MDFIQGILGHICYTLVVFIAGALIGRPVWGWFCKAMPWNNATK